MIGVINSPSKKGILDEAKSYSDTKLTEANKYTDDKVSDKLTSCIRHKQSGTFTNSSSSISLSGFKDNTKMIAILDGGTYSSSGSSTGTNVDVKIPYCDGLSTSKLSIGYSSVYFEANRMHSNLSAIHMNYTVIEFY